MYLEPDIVEKTYISLGGWKTMREEKESYFDVKKEDIGIRVKEPNEICIRVLCTPGKEELYTLYFDVIDDYMSNLNRVFDKSDSQENNGEKIKFAKE